MAHLHTLEPVRGCLIEDWLPDETLYSVACRQHLLFGNILAADTCRLLFGHARRGTQHDIPYGLTHFIALTEGHLGNSAQEICHDHTLLPFYWPWLPGKQLERSLAAIAGNGCLCKQAMGLPSSRFGAEHPLKYCPSCTESDHRVYGTPYWHRMHQYPLVWICPIHGCLLQQLPAKTNGVGRFLWFLPPRQSIRQAQTRDVTAWTDLAQLVLCATGALDKSPINYGHLWTTYRERLLAIGFGRGQRQLDQRAILDSYGSSLHGIQLIPEVHSARLGRCTPWALQGLLYHHCMSTHPARHLIFIRWLFGSWQPFWEAYQSRPDGQRARAGNDPACHTSDLTQRKAIVVALIGEGRSATYAARQVNVTTSTAQRWAAAAGVQPSINRTPLTEALTTHLLQGTAVNEIAAGHRVTAQLVTRLLLRTVGLHHAWLSARWKSRQVAARSRWLIAHSDQPYAGVKKLRSLEPAAYAWLYRNDRTWLTNHLPNRQVSAAPKQDRVDWPARDMALSDAVVRLVREYQAVNLPAPSRQDMYAAIPALRRLASKLSKLPTTRSSLTASTRGRW